MKSTGLRCYSSQRETAFAQKERGAWGQADVNLHVMLDSR